MNNVNNVSTILAPMRTSRIGVDSDGNPVFYDPEKAMNKNYPKDFGVYIPEMQGEQQVIEKLKELSKQSYIEANKKGLERSPEDDTFVPNNYLYDQKDLIAASIKIPPKVKDAATDVLIDLIKQYGVNAVVALVTFGWDALFGNKNAEQPETQAPEKPQPSYDYTV